MRRFAEDRPPSSLANRLIDKRAPTRRLHHSAVRVRKARQACRPGAFEQCERKRMRLGCGLYVHRSVPAAIMRIGLSRPRLDSTAIEFENGFITPRSIARLGSVKIPI